VQAQIYVGPQYQAKSNTVKTSELYYASTNNTSPSSFPTVGLVELFLENMDTSFDTVADDMPNQFLGLQRRPKLIHSVGVVALASWVPLANGKGYTGVLSGCSNVVVRLSLAKKPATGAKGYAPGIALKCLRSGTKSGNLFAMFSLEGQDSWNFFKHDLTNHVPDLSSSADSLLLKLRDTFGQASDWPTMIGLSDLAEFDENGKNMTTPKFPFRLVFHPVTSVRNMFTDTPTADPFGTLARTLRPGTLYTIYAQDQPTDTQDQLVLIGRLDLRTATTTSNFADKYLFFQHTRMENDFYYKPTWAPFAQQILNQQRNTNYYTFPDLPFN